MSREDEIRQGLREPSGALTFPLDVIDYGQGMEDFENGVDPPKMSSASYDLGRFRAREKRELEAEVMDEIEARSRLSRAAVRDALKDRPDLLAEYDAKIAEIDGERR